MSELRTVVENFTIQLAKVIEDQIMDRARHAVAAALSANGQVPARRGRPPKSQALASAWEPTKKPRKKAPKQLCPVPGCKNPAAPVFGMVCSDHKDVSKAKIKKYREVRRAQKDGTPTAKPAARAAKPKARAKAKLKPRAKANLKVQGNARKKAVAAKAAPAPAPVPPPPAAPPVA